MYAYVRMYTYTYACMPRTRTNQRACPSANAGHRARNRTRTPTGAHPRKHAKAAPPPGKTPGDSGRPETLGDSCIGKTAEDSGRPETPGDSCMHRTKALGRTRRLLGHSGNPARDSGDTFPMFRQKSPRTLGTSRSLPGVSGVARVSWRVRDKFF